MNEETTGRPRKPSKPLKQSQALQISFDQQWWMMELQEKNPDGGRGTRLYTVLGMGNGKLNMWEVKWAEFGALGAGAGK